MSVYIPGLSMPRKTGIVSIVLSGDGSALLCEDGAYSEIKVIPVPEHGRLIDGDALKEKHHWTDDFYETEYVEVEDIDSAPTIIPASEEEQT